MKKKGCSFALAFLVLFRLAVVPVLAHALLVRSIPEANAVLDRAPAQVELFFSETVDPTFSTIKVLDTNAQPVDNGDTQVDPADAAHLTVSLRSLPDGIYTVSWKALSATDSHVTLGSFPFAVGNVDAAALADTAQASKQIKLSIGEVAAKWLLYLSAMVIVGSLLFSAAVWQPARRAAQIDRDVAQPPWQRLSNLALIGLLVASGIGLLVQAGQASGTEIAGPWAVATNGVLFATRYGTLWIARLILTLALMGLILRNAVHLQTSRREQSLTFGVALLLLLSISLSSHAAGEPQPVLPIAADVIHLLAASVWVGGLMSFVLGVWSIRKIEPATRTRFTARLIPRFSALALISVAVLAMTGVYSSILQIGTLDALWNTLYGRALVVKLLIALPMIGLGAISLLIITPRIQRAAADPTSTPRLADRFRRSVTSEVALGVVLVLSVGVFTSLPPARSASSASDLSAVADVADLTIGLDITPGRVGVNTFAISLASNGQAVDNVKTLEARFTPANGSVAPSQAQLIGQGNGAYAIKGAYLSLPDTWQVQIVVRRDNHFDVYADFTFPLNAAGTSANVPWNRVSGGLLFVAALMYMFAFRRFEFSRGPMIAIELAPALALVLIGTLVFAQAPIESGGPINPIPPNAASVAAGKTIFEEKCVPCHGESGKGDGPIGITLNPRPADLTQHAIPGVHTDGQLFGWITNGFPGSVMPPFRQALSDDDRWNVVNFIRTLAPKSTP
jgi:copper transport protein